MVVVCVCGCMCVCTAMQNSYSCCVLCYFTARVYRWSVAGSCNRWGRVECSHDSVLGSKVPNMSR